MISFIIQLFIVIFNSICILKDFVPTWINIYIAVIIGLFASLLLF